MSETLVSPSIDEELLFSGMTVDRLCTALRRGYLSEERTQYELSFALQGADREVLYTHLQQKLQERSLQGIDCIATTCVPLLASHDSDNGVLGAHLVAGLHSEYKNGAKAAAYIWQRARDYTNSTQGGYHASMRVAATFTAYSNLIRDVKSAPETMIDMPPDDLHIVSGNMPGEVLSGLREAAAAFGYRVILKSEIAADAA